jgi:hypothetical protein
MKKSLGLFLFLTLAGVAFAQDASDKQVSTTRYDATVERTPLDLFTVYGSYVFKSDLQFDDDDDDDFTFGEQDAIETGLSYSHRFLITGKVYLRAGFSYHRFDFGSTGAPVPSHLQSASAIVALEYMVGDDVGAFIQFDPGFYAENDFNSHSVDVPITLGRAFVLQPRKLFLFVGANSAFLRGQYPVLPLVGIVWRPNEQWKLDLIPPQPRIIYSPNERLDLWLGGQIAGSSFRTDRDDNIFPPQLNGAQVDYSEYRAGLGFTWHPSEQIALDVGGGYAFQRRFNFERADVEFKTDPAPYVRVALKAEF